MQLETKLCSRNLIKGINTRAVALVRYSGPFFKWTREELQQMDQRTRELITRRKALHPCGDVDRLYVSRKKEGRGFASMEDSVNTSIQWLQDYIGQPRRKTDYSHRNNPDNTSTNRKIIIRKQKWEEKQIYGRFKRLICNISYEKTYSWIRKG